MSRHHTSARRLLRRKVLATGLAIGTFAAVLVPATGASAAGCGFLGLFPCANSIASRVPGTPVTPVNQVNTYPDPVPNPKVGSVPNTAKIGKMDAGVVPVIGKVSAQADDGAYVLYEKQMDARTVDLMISSPALGGAAAVRLMLPKDWSTSPTATWPSMYLLTGGHDATDYQTWSWNTHIEQYTANANALIVMPSVGAAGFVTNFWNYGLGSLGGYQYDTYLATELPQILQRGYRAGSKAVVAGISSGGYSSVALAALHPGRFAVAASYSGLPDTQAGNTAITIELMPLVMWQVPLAMWGDSIGQWYIWNANNPAAHLSGLKGTKVIISSGNGTAGPLDPPGSSGDTLMEPIVLASSQGFVQKASAAGLDVTADFYGPGTHSWTYWEREWVRSWPSFAAGLGIPA